MNKTIKDVLAHPAMKRLVFTKNRMEIENMRDILLVLQLYGELQSIYKKRKLTELITAGDREEFLHYKECPWTVARAGEDVPNTCDCRHVDFKCKNILEILDKLHLVTENQRLKTFTTQWPHSTPSPENLAAAGFYYFGNSDSVRCSFCGVEIGKWEKDDNPLILHKKWSPACPHLKRRKTRVSI